MNDFFVGAVVLDSDDYVGLADFYSKLLNGNTVESNANYIMIQLPSGLRLSFQNAEGYVPPTWPEAPGKPQQMLHLDIMVENLDDAVVAAEKLGAKKSIAQFVPYLTVMLDPAGHPFCLVPKE